MAKRQRVITTGALLVVLVAVSLGCTDSASRAQAKTPNVASLRSALARSKSIVEGYVQQAQGREGTTGSAKRRMIYTDVTFWVNRRVTIDPVGPSRIESVAAAVTFSVPGGQIGDQAIEVSGSPSFEPGDKLILILDGTHPDAPVLGGRQGMLRLRDGRVFTDDDRPVVGISDKGIEAAPSAAENQAGSLPVPQGNARGEAVVVVNGVDRAMTTDAALEALAKVLTEGAL